MTTIDDLLKEFPGEARGQLRTLWDTLPEGKKQELQDLTALLPGNVALWRMLLDLALVQFKMAFGDKRAFAIVGPANVGKSTLYNQLVRSREDRAEVSPVPGTTRVNQSADAGLFGVVDTPGADAVGEVGEAEKEQALAAAQEADFLIIVFDAIQGIKRTEQELYDELAALGKPHVVVLNKIDLAGRHTQRVVDRAAANLRLETHQIIPMAAKDGRNLDRLLMAMAKAEPEIVAALGRALPEFRWRLAWTAITGAASTSAAIALTPLPVLDMIPLLAVQSSLVLGIARLYNYEITLDRAKELVATFGLGMLGRTLFQQLSKLGGPPGWLLSAAIAASTTAVMGYASIVWFEKGERLSTESMRALTKNLTDYVVEALKGLGRRKPGKKNLEQRMKEVLENAPMARDRTDLDRQAQTEPAEAGAANPDRSETNDA